MKIKEFNEPTSSQPDTQSTGMAQNQLLKIGQHAIKIENMIGDSAEMNPWVAKKIDLVSNYVKSVHGNTSSSEYDDNGMSEDGMTSADVDRIHKQRYSDKEVRMAKGVAFDKRYKGGNYTGASNTIEKLKKGLSSHPDVADALKRANEDPGYYKNPDKEFNINGLTTKQDVVQSIIDNIDNNELDTAKDSLNQLLDVVTALHEYDTPEKKAERDALMQKYLNKGGKIEKVPTGKTAYKNKELKPAYRKDNGTPITSPGSDESVEEGPPKMARRDHRAYKGDHAKIMMAIQNLQQLITDANLGDDEKESAMVSLDQIQQDMATLYDSVEANGVQPVDLKRMGASEPKIYVHKDGKTILIPKRKHNEYLAKGWKKSALRAETSPLKETAKMAIELIELLNNGSSIDEATQNILNQAADNLQAVYHYEDYQKQNPYSEEIDSALVQKHSQLVQAGLEGILAHNTKVEDVDTKPGMMRILKKRVNEIEKDIAKENRTNEAPIEQDKDNPVAKPYVDMPEWKALHDMDDKIIDAYIKHKEVKEGGMPSSIIKHKQKLAHMSDEELADRFKGYDEKKLRQMAWSHGYGNMSSHYLDRVRNVITSKRTATPEAELEEGLKDWAKNLAMAGVIVGSLAGVGSINDAMNNSVPAVKAMNTAYEMAVDAGNTELANNIKKDISDAKVRLDSGKDLNHIKHLQNKYSKFMSTEGLAYESKLAVQLNKQLK